MNQLVLPDNIKYLPLYINTLNKSLLLRKQKTGVSSNAIKDLINRIFSDPNYLVAKMMYPKLYRVDNMNGSQEEEIALMTNITHEQLLYDIGEPNNYGTYTKPYLIPLSYDNIEFESKLKINYKRCVCS